MLLRYAGHPTATTMQYIAGRAEHAKKAFLATGKLTADGTRVEFFRDDHERLHLFDRADRILPPRLVRSAAPALLREGRSLPDLLAVRH